MRSVVCRRFGSLYFDTVPFPTAEIAQSASAPAPAGSGEMSWKRISVSVCVTIKPDHKHCYQQHFAGLPPPCAAAIFFGGFGQFRVPPLFRSLDQQGGTRGMKLIVIRERYTMMSRNKAELKVG
jgi:hypothetical protein